MNQVFGAAADGQEQLPEHATVASALPSYLPASQLLQVEAPASEYLPATMSPSLSSPTAPPDAVACHPKAPCWGAVGRGGVQWGTGERGLPAGHDEQVDDEFAPTANEYVPATPRHPHSQLTDSSSRCRRVSPHCTLLGCGRARGGGLGGLPAGHREQNVSLGRPSLRVMFQFPTKPAPVLDESLVNLTRMYPVVDVQMRLEEILLPLSDASSVLDLHDVAPSDDEQL